MMRVDRLFSSCCRIALGIACSAGCLVAAAADGPDAADPVAYSDAHGQQPVSRVAAYAPYLDIGSAMLEEDAERAAGYPWRGPSAEQPDWRGIRRDTGYFLGYQFAILAVLYVAPESVSGWDSEAKRDYSFSRWRDNATKPVWDKDSWWINYITHPYWGGTYYIRAQERGFDRAQSFWYSALLSTLFEVGAEALAEPASIQDLVVTPVGGYLVGEYLFLPLRKRIRAKPGKLSWSDKAMLVLTDPLGVVSAETDRLLGVKTMLQWQPIGMPLPAHAAGMGSAATGPLENPRSAAPVWGLQLRIDW
jgi:hypothetical protein